MNGAVFIVFPSMAARLFPAYVPSNSTTHLLRQFCNATETFVVDRSVAVVCVNTALSPVALSGLSLEKDLLASGA